AAAALADRAARCAPYTVCVDLEGCRLSGDGGFSEPFGIDAVSRGRLLDGRDEIDRLLDDTAAITDYERRRGSGLAPVVAL
ncbi:MAG: hypothetical protein LC791_05060, partial [Acidobacteria bacterium]|nr:hypothetical protein [Acidobacteriota bacterium]